jgi:diacylglycerol kinase family enzyme
MENRDSNAANSSNSPEKGARGRPPRRSQGQGQGQRRGRGQRPGQTPGQRPGRPVRNRGQRTKSHRPRRRVTLLVNAAASKHQPSTVLEFARLLSAGGYEVETLHPETSAEMASQAVAAAKKRPLALVAVGGDGAVNLVARALIGSDVRLAVLPQGKCNSFFTSLVGKPSLSLAVEAFKSGAARAIDCGAVSGQPFFTSVGLGLLPALCEALSERSLPRFGIGWARLTSRVAAGIQRHRTPVRIDAYRFDLEPMMITVSLLPYCLGLNLSPTAIPDDHRLEVTLDMGQENEPPSKFIRDIYKQNHRFDNGIRLYRGEEIIIGSTKGRMLYLDGELISTPTNNLEISIQREQILVCLPETA